MRTHLRLLPLLLLAAPTARAHPDHDGILIPVVANRGAGNIPRVAVAIEGDKRIVRSNGLPDHAPGAFPRKGNPNTVAAQDYTFAVPLEPEDAPEPVFRGGWFFGVALNGVPFEAGTGEFWENDRRSGWNYEAMTGFLNLGIDAHNAHVQPTGAYHYHGLPLGMETGAKDADGPPAMRLLGWAADGYPIYDAAGHDDPKDAASPVRALRPSYRLKEGERPDGPGGKYDGTFTADFEYVEGLGDLDALNGIFGVTPEFPEGTYHYHITDAFPFLGRSWKGTPDPSFSKGGGPGGPGGPGGRGPEGERPLPPVVRALDANGDGEIDAGEIAGAPDALGTLDTNGDGKLDREELRPPFPPDGPPPGRP